MMGNGIQKATSRHVAKASPSVEVPKPPYLVKLDVTSFRGMSIGATHYYGKISINNKSNCGGYGAPQHPLDRFEIQRPITKELAKELDEKDGGDYFQTYIREGLTTGRFDKRDHVHAAAIEWFEVNFDKTSDVLIVEKDVKHHTENYWETHLVVLSGPENIKQELDAAKGDFVAQDVALKNHKQ